MSAKPVKSQEPKNKEVENELNAFKLRKDFSADDIHSLISNMDSLISEYKADQKGFDPKNMVKTVRGGKTVWITKDEMNATLSKQRRLIGKKSTQNQSQDGVQESSESYRRLSISQHLIDTIRKISPEKSLPFVKSKRNLEAQMNQSSSQAKDYRLMEQALQ